MQNAIIIHGMPSKEEFLDTTISSPASSHWLPWVKAQLEKRDIIVSIPEMPVPYEPEYTSWAALFEQNSITPKTILIGHSLGAGFLIRWLSEHPLVVIDKMVLVAPWIDPAGEITTGFFDFTLDTSIVNRTQGVIVMYSTDDEDVIMESVDLLRTALPGALFQKFTNKGHFTLGDFGTTAFPEILEHLIVR